MILPNYRVAASTIPGAGKGVFVEQPVVRGRILVAPDAIPRVYRWDEIMAMPDRDEALAASVRWFEDRYTVSPEWPDECYLNHSFSPTGIWHLGFVFATAELTPGTELTVDYRHLLATGQVEAFRDSQSGQEIVGFSWAESFALSLGQLSALQNT